MTQHAQLKPRPIIDLDDTRIDLDALQGNILKGHGRDHSTHLFIRFGGDVALTRHWLKSLLPPDGGASPRIAVTSHRAQMAQIEAHREAPERPGDLFLNLLLGSSAYASLGHAVPGDPAFANGMAASGTVLSDPEPEHWEAGYREPIDAMLLLAHDDRKALAQFDSLAREMLAEAGATVVAVEYGDAQRNAQGNHVEHFGYVDGRSQPLYLKEDIERERQKTVGLPVWDAAEDPIRLVLATDETAGDHGCYGSYFVFRKLEQNVRGFKDAEAHLAQLLGLTGEDAERAGAMLVGRFEDGTPVVNNAHLSGAKDVADNFSYDSDRDGRRCPLHAHTRKMNPRGDLVTRFGVDEESAERNRRITRRAIPYGVRAADLSDRPEGGVGLLFMCFQKSIPEQFEFMQSSWGNTPDFPAPSTGVDPVIGQGAATLQPQPWPNGWGEAGRPFACNFQPHVRLKGGCYLFAPSLKGIARLAQ